MQRMHWGRLPWPALAVGILAAALYVGTAGWWPWDHDEVSGLIEVGAAPLQVEGAPAVQLRTIRAAVPVWYVAQGAALAVLPPNEFGARFLPACSAAASILVLFVFAWKRDGPLVAWAAALVMGLSQPLLLIGQNDRFYSTAVFLQMLVFTRLDAASGAGVRDLLLTALLTLAAVLTHNLLVVFFCLCFAAAVLAYAFGTASRALLMRSGVAAAVSAATYFFYLRGVVSGWTSGGLGSASAVVSFSSAAGVPLLALAGFGAGAVLADKRGATDPPAGSRRLFQTLLAAATILFFLSWHLLLESWNAWYAFLFMAPFWWLAAHGVADIANAFQGMRRAAWFGCVLLLLLPKAASYLRDGSRHDLRRSAEVIAADLRGGEAVYANWPSELQYYLARHGHTRVTGWWPGGAISDGECLIAFASNAYEPPLTIPGRAVSQVGQVFTRRFDEESYVVTIYRVSARTAGVP
jgi:hypothetical protein